MDRNDALLADWRQRALALEAEVGKAVIGQERVIRLVNTAVFARGHVLLQGDVGVGKTTLLRAFAQVLGGAFARIEGTIDLMPNDLVYYTYISDEGRPAVEPGPLIRHGEDLAIFFFNEINRARPQVHSLLLRVMAERSVHGLQPRVPLSAPAGVRRPQPRRARRDLRDLVGRARPLHDGDHHRRARRPTTQRRALMFDPRFHDTDRAGRRAGRPAMVPLPRAQRAWPRSSSASVQASDALQRYALDLWRATAEPADFGVQLERRRHARS